MRILISLMCALSACTLVSCGSKTEAPSAQQVSPYFLAQDKTITIDGIDIRYRDEGLKDGETLVMVHGFTSSLETWDALAKNLKADYRIIRLDLPGHGLTGPDPKERYTNEETVEFLGRFLVEVNVEAPILIGNSLGGLVSWRLAAKSPEKVSRLVLIAPGGFSINGVTDEPVLVPLMVRMFLTKAPKAGIKHATSALFADPSKLTEARLKEVRDMMVAAGNGDAFVARAASFTLPDPTADLQSVVAPTLLIWGEKDVMVPAAQGAKFAENIPNAALKIYSDAGHVPQEETPEQLAADIRTFLQKQE